jgi:FAD/FMN-containing dehydrogenase
MISCLLSKAHESLCGMEAFPAKLYGDVADIAYKRVHPNWTQKQREVKKMLDKKNIMNPGKLCFNF